MNASELDLHGAEKVTALPNCLERFTRLFNQMSSDHLGDLEGVYHKDVRFTDPFTTVGGLTALKQYFEGAYSNVISCHFEFSKPIENGAEICLPWIMTLQHRRLKGGDAITVNGISHLVITDNRIISHRDYFDAGELLYENLPVLGGAVRWLRKHAS
ncbi:nuclear transport factor 2 family protein [Marinobacter sp. BGYM27]|uniref:nuclear transport factor 2 family protein n=1 Tax=unclassified Marinobacter TaxID=83889 RepID=UPI0021A9415A|nr:nuclear transport factor 2 family protein [Marinobacter sp. BGYM27]MDG5500323.1 nuclear transport factor 2 family protein [Marinobacter sp. BGYM27]